MRFAFARRSRSANLKHQTLLDDSIDDVLGRTASKEEDKNEETPSLHLSDGSSASDRSNDSTVQYERLGGMALLSTPPSDLSSQLKDTILPDVVDRSCKENGCLIIKCLDSTVKPENERVEELQPREPVWKRRFKAAKGPIVPQNEVAALRKTRSSSAIVRVQSLTPVVFDEPADTRAPSAITIEEAKMQEDRKPGRVDRVQQSQPEKAAPPVPPNIPVKKERTVETTSMPIPDPKPLPEIKPSVDTFVNQSIASELRDVSLSTILPSEESFHTMKESIRLAGNNATVAMRRVGSNASAALSLAGNTANVELRRAGSNVSEIIHKITRDPENKKHHSLSSPSLSFSLDQTTFTDASYSYEDNTYTEDTILTYTDEETKTTISSDLHNLSPSELKKLEREMEREAQREKSRNRQKQKDRTPSPSRRRRSRRRRKRGVREGCNTEAKNIMLDLSDLGCSVPELREDFVSLAEIIVSEITCYQCNEDTCSDTGTSME